jgi:hypothetical protein
LTCLPSPSGIQLLSALALCTRFCTRFWLDALIPISCGLLLTIEKKKKKKKDKSTQRRPGALASWTQERLRRSVTFQEKRECASLCDNKVRMDGPVPRYCTVLRKPLK